MSGGCQLADEASGDSLDTPSPRRAAVERGVAPLCLRCNANRCATVHRQQPLCRACHVETFTNRFRQTLKRECGVQPTSRVLAGWSGGLSSSVLCELLRAGCADRGKYRLMLHWDIVHVDCAAIRRPTTAEQRAADEAQREQLLSRYQTTAHIIPLSAVFDIPGDRKPVASAGSRLWFSLDVEHRSGRDEQLRALFRSVQPASHPSLLSCLLAHLLSYTCLCGDYAAVLTAESATHAAGAVISAIARGQGRIAAVHTRMQRHLMGARWAYPMHDTSHTHIAYMFHYQQLSTLSAIGAIHASSAAPSAHSAATPPAPPNSSTPSTPPVATLDSLSRSFIASLDSLFGHSVANVLRTVEKVDRPDDASSDSHYCCWCGEMLPPAQPFEQSLSTQSHQRAQPLPAHGITEASPTSATLSSLSSSHFSPLACACYDCRRSFTLPLQPSPQQLAPDCIRLFDSAAHTAQQLHHSDVTAEAEAAADGAAGTGRVQLESGAHQRRSQKQSAEQMRAHIQQFLLEESNEVAQHRTTTLSQADDATR